ncbi:protein kinase [Candidatus Sumerlaeota bacterium]|nr:protein kinase [Candidatus Sumerlaeota bacterium]
MNPVDGLRMSLCLTVLEKGATTSHWFPDGKVTIGRSPTCDLQVDPTIHSHVSRFHGRFVRESPNVYSYEDLESMHGSYREAEELQGKVMLRRGESIFLGREGPEVHITWEEERITGKDGTHIRRYQKDSPHFPLIFSNGFRDQYRRYEKIATGGFGEVWKAKPMADDQPALAIKLLNPLFLDPQHLGNTDRTSLIRRFARESHIMHLLAQSGAPGFVKVHQWGDEPERDYLYMIMDFVEAPPLDKLIIRDELDSLKKALRVLLAIAKALDAAHSFEFTDETGKPCKGVIHRDIKPNNILVDSSTDHVWLIDFGIAGVLKGGERLTAANITVGTLQFLPIESIETDVISTATDLWAFVLTMYLIFSKGRFPYHGKTRSELVTALRSGKLTPLQQYRKDLPQPLVDAINLSLSSNPRERVQSASEWARLISSQLKAIR